MRQKSAVNGKQDLTRSCDLPQDVISHIFGCFWIHGCSYCLDPSLRLAQAASEACALAVKYLHVFPFVICMYGCVLKDYLAIPRGPCVCAPALATRIPTGEISLSTSLLK